MSTTKDIRNNPVSRAMVRLGNSLGTKISNRLGHRAAVASSAASDTLLVVSSQPVDSSVSASDIATSPPIASVAVSDTVVVDAPDVEYNRLLRTILTTGKRRTTRNGDTLAVFGERLVFPDVTTAFPLLSGKRVYWKGVVEELLWFLAGSTDVSKLRDRGVHIWDGNSTREYLDSHNLSHYKEHEEGGPIYGYQWRHFGATYIDCHTDYTGQGVDQITEIIKGIKADPAGRRHILSAWNPPDLPGMILPACHVMYQFFVDPDEKTLDCQMYQRSCDTLLGLPFNQASTATLMMLVAAATDYTARKLIIVIGDAHLYANHIEQAKEQIEREIRPPPQLRILRDPVPEDLHDLAFEDFVVDGYTPHAAIKAPMAA